MLNFFKQLVCKHNYSFHRVTYGDENNYSLPNRKVERCSKCDAQRYVEMTDEDWLRDDWEKVSESLRETLGIKNYNKK